MQSSAPDELGRGALAERNPADTVHGEPEAVEEPCASARCSGGAQMSDTRETTARWVGIGVAFVAMLLFWRSIRWPAPAISAAIGYGAYRLARGGS
jgi:hypothetical protein